MGCWPSSYHGEVQRPIHTYGYDRRVVCIGLEAKVVVTSTITMRLRVSDEAIASKSEQCDSGGIYRCTV